MSTSETAAKVGEMSISDMAPIFTSDKNGNDETGDGSEATPF